MGDLEEDEDVVFEGSAIYHHLHDTGFTDFESTQLITSPCKEDFTRDDSCENIKATQDSLTDKWSRLHTAALGRWKLEDVSYKYIAEYIAQSKLVNNDDWLVLEHFMPGGEELRLSGSVGGSTASWPEIIFFIGFRSILLLVIPLLCLASGSWLISIGIIILTFSIFVIVGDMSALLCHLILIHDIEKFVLLMKETSQSISKSVRLLQEVDLITKGFVLAQGSSRGTFCENTEFPQCSNLCSAFNSTVSSLAQVLHQNHSYFRHYSPEYPCMKQLFDPIEIADVKETGYNTEYISFLKKWAAVVKLQLSAVLTELLLCLHKPTMLDKLSSSRNQLFSYSHIFLVSRETKSLTNHLKYTRSFWLQDRQDKRETRSFEEKKKNVYIALHSLSLHMQAALFRVYGLENRFESENNELAVSQDLEQKKLDVFPSYEYMREQLDALKMELDSCQGCLDEAEARVDRKYGMNDNEVIPKLEHLETADNLEDNVASQEVKKPIIVLYDMEEPVIEDEVFEAYIDEDYCDRQGGTCDDDFWKANARKERQLLKQQKAQGKRVLNELQPILVKRRKMWEKREMVALNRHNAKEVQAFNISSTHTEQTSKKSDCKREQLLEDSHKDSDIGRTFEGGKIVQNIEKTKTQDNPESLLVYESKLACDSVEQDTEEETDSDEERLQLYRKVKQELDEDEKTRVKEGEEEEGAVAVCGASLESFKTHVDLKELKKYDIEEYEESENMCQKEEKHVFSLPFLHKSTFNNDNLSGEDIGYGDHYHELSNVNINEDRVNKPNRNPLSNCKSGAVKCDNTVDGTPQEEKSISFATEFNTGNCLFSEEKSTKVDEVRVTNDEEFVHNEDADDDSSTQIDWSVITLPTRQMETIDERMQLFSAGHNIGFQAKVAAEAQAASRKFWTTASNLTETFGGTGEGEEVFGDNDDTEEEED